MLANVYSLGKCVLPVLAVKAKEVIIFFPFTAVQLCIPDLIR